MKRLFIITGGYGCGKSTVLNILASRGFSILEEQARKLIQKEQTKNVAAPKNKPEFQIEVSKRQLLAEKALPEGTSFLDRSIIDNIAYLQSTGQEVPKELQNMFSKKDYERAVFFFETPPQEKYGQDEATFKSHEESAAFSKIAKGIYEDHGFIIIPIQFDTFENQADLIEKHILRKTR